MISNTVLFFRHVGRGGSGLRHVRGVLLCVALFAVLLLSTAVASAQTVTLHPDSGRGDNLKSDTPAPAADNMTFDSTPKVTLAGFTGSITVTSTSDGQTDVVDTFAAGNGDRDLSTLAPGEWLISAVDSATPTANTATLTITVLHPMVSNFAESDDGTLVVGDFDGTVNVRKIAQAFTTGVDEFRLRELQIDLGSVSSPSSNAFEIELMTANGADPGTRVTTNGCNIFNEIAANELSANNVFTYEIPESKDCTLAPNTTYFLVFQIKNTTNPGIHLKAVSSDTQSGRTGWSIGDACRKADVATENYGSTGSWGDCAGGKSVKLGLFGTLVSQLLVSNLGQTFPSSGLTTYPNGIPYAQQFTTGSTPFVPTAISFTLRVVDDPFAGSTTVSIQRVDSDGYPDGVNLASVDIASENIAVGANVADFTSSNVVLKPNTDYAVLIRRVAGGTGSFQLRYTTSASEDAGGVSGFSIADAAFAFFRNSGWSVVTNIMLGIAIQGKSEPVAYLKDASDTGTSPQDRRTHNYTPTIVLSGFSGTVTVRATASGETAVQTTRNGDGEVTLPRLTPGKEWTITATDTATPSNTDSFAVHVDKLLVGNFSLGDTSSSVWIGGTTVLAQRFTTDADAYVLEEIQYVINPAADLDNEFIISVQGKAGNGNPDGTKLATINVDHDVVESAGTKIAALDTPLILSASTDYFIVFEYPTSGRLYFHRYNAADYDHAAEDVTASGWSMRDGYTTYDGSVWRHWDIATLKMALNGSLVPTQTVVLAAGSDLGSSNSDRLTSDTTPDITVAGFGNTASITVTATKVGTTTTKSKSGTGNGAYTLPTLSEGKWRVVARDTTLGDVTLPIIITIDTTPPTLSDIQNLGTVDATPTFTFTSSEAGVITLGGDCASITTAAVEGENTVTFTALSPGQHANCTVRVTDAAGNQSTVTSIPAFTVSPTTISVVMSQTDPAQSRSATATVSVPGDGSATDLKWRLFDPNAQSANSCDSTLDFTSAGTYVSGTALTVADADADNGKQVCFKATAPGTTVYQASAVITGIDTTPPAISNVGSIGFTTDTTPDVTYDIDGAATVTITCGATTTDNPSASASRTVALGTAVTPGVYKTCTIDAEDAVGNAATQVAIPAFRVMRTLVSNLSENDSSTLTVGPSFRGQRFDVGTTPYVLKQAQFVIRTAASANVGREFSVSVYESGSNNLPSGTALATVVVPHVTIESTGTKTVTFDEPVHLQASSAYHLVFAYSGSGGTTMPQLGGTNATSENGLTGFSIHNAREVSSDGVTWTAQGNDPTKIGIIGFAVPTQTVDLTAATDTGVSTDNITKDNTPDITVAGFDAQDSITVTARKGDTDKTATRTGNGSVTMPTLADGVWKIFATSGVDTTLSLEVTIDTALPELSNLQDLGTVQTATPTFTFTSSEAGAIAVGGGCSTADTTAVKGDNTITFGTLTAGRKSGCTITVTDTAGNVSATGTIPTFTVPTPLVANTGQTDFTTSESNIVAGRPHAQMFTTGSTPFTLSAVSFRIQNAAPDVADTFTVSIQGAFDYSSYPVPDGFNLASVEVTDENVAGDKMVDFSSADVLLKPNTSYFAVFDYTGSSADSFALTTTESDDEDAGGVTGFSIDDVFFHDVASDVDVFVWAPLSRAIEIAVRGEEVGGALAYLTSASDTGTSPHDRRTHDYTPTIALSGFSGTVTVRATASGETAVQTTRNGDGEVTLPRLAPGKVWTITATDTATPANTDSLTVHVDKLLAGNLGLGLTEVGVDLDAGTRYAQVFQVYHDGPYAIEEIQYSVKRAAADVANEFIISVQRTNSQGRPNGTRLATINVDHDDIETTGTKAAVFDVPLVLPDSLSFGSFLEYAIVFEYVEHTATTNQFQLGSYAASGKGGEDTTATGWRVSDTHLFAPSGSSWREREGGNVFKVALNGSPIPTQTVVLAAGSDLGLSNSDRLTSDTTPDITVAGFGDTASITVTATKVGTTTTKSKSGTGNGAYTLPALSEGKWRVVARDTTLGDVTLPIIITIDTTAPVLSDIQNLGTVGTTPSFTFTSSEVGLITWGGDCTSATTSAFQGENTVTFTALSPGQHANCTVRVTDVAGNQSTVTPIPAFTVSPVTVSVAMDQSNPAPSRSATATVVVTGGGSATGLKWRLFDPNANTPEVCDSTLDFTTSSTYTSGVAVEIANAEADNGKQACFQATASGATFYRASAVIAGIDKTGPVISNVGYIGFTADTTPNVAYDIDEAATVTITCGGATTTDNPSASGSRTVALGTALTPGVYKTCTIDAVDAVSGAAATQVAIPAFRVMRTLVSNLSKTTFANLAIGSSVNDHRGQRFDTGTTPYVLRQVQFAVGVAASADAGREFSVSIYGSGSNNLPSGTALATVVVPHATIESAGTKTATFDEPVHLQASSAYHVVFRYSGSGGTLPKLSTTRLSATGFQGFDIHDVREESSDGVAWVAQGYDVMKIGIIGFAVPTQTVDLTAATDTSVSTDNITKDNTPDITVAGFDAQDSVTVTARKGDTDKTATRTGNGSVTMPTLADGVWKIFATSGVDTTLSLVVTIDTTLPELSNLQDLGTVYTTTPTFTFTSSEAGAIAVGGGCSTADTTAVKGDNTITFGTLTAGTKSGCTITVTDTAGNVSTTGTIPTFTVLLAGVAIPLVANTGQTDVATETNLIDGEQQAQAFTTGSIPFELSSVAFDMRNAAPDTNDTFTVSIQGSDGTNPDGVDLASVEVTDEGAAGDKTVDFSSANLILKPSTTYFVVFTYDGAAGDTVALQTTAADNEDAGGQSGFSIANAFRHYTSNAWTSVDRAIELSMSGSPGPMMYLKSTSDTGKSPHDRRTFDPTPTVVLSGFTGTVTVRATASGETAVQKTRSGDGEVTLPRLTPGKPWNITATDTASTPNTDTLTVQVDNLLVGNFGLGLQESAIQVYSGFLLYAQGFTTDADAYALEEIQYVVDSEAADLDNTFIISVQGVDNSGNPDGNDLATINVDHDVIESRGTKTAVLDVPLVLAANTKYAIVLQYIGGGSGIEIAQWWRDSGGVSRFDEDPSATGWSIANARQTRQSLSRGWTSNSAGYVMQMALKGSRVPAQSVDLKADSDTGVSNTDNITSVNTPTIVVGGFGASDAVTVTAQKAGTSTTVSKAGTGNGDYVLPKLSDGKWYITARNVLGDRALRIAITVDSDNPDLLVSNTGQTVDSGSVLITSTKKRAQQFTTGTDAYSLKQVQYRIHTAASDANETFTVSIQGVSNGNPDGTKIASVNVDHDDIEATGLKTATFAAPAILDANTNYFVVFEYSRVSGGVRLSYTTSGNEDTGGVTGWSIADGNRSFTSSSWGDGGTATLSVGLYGTVLQYRVDLQSGSDSGSSQTDNITNDNTPTFDVSGFADSATVTVTAEHATADDVSVEKGTAGNGAVTLTTLAEGAWTVTASDDASPANTSPSITVTIDTAVPDASVSATNFTGHLSGTDLYINKADADAASGAILTAPTQSFTYGYKVVGSSTTCDGDVTYASAIPETDDVTTDGTHKICIKAEDTAGNIQYLTTPTFTRDTVIPVISSITPIGAVYDTTPDLVFQASEAGTLVAVAGCGIPADAVRSGSNTITLDALAPNTYAACTFYMDDPAGNRSAANTLPGFTINPGGISVAALSTDPATSRSATATVTGTNPTGLNWALFNPNAQPAETCGSGLTFPAGNTYTSGNAVVVSSSEADNGKKVCFRATISGNTVYEESDAIAGIDTTNPVAVLTFSTDQAVANTFAAFTPGGTDLFLKSGQKVRFTDASTDTGGIDESTRDFAAKIGTTAEYTANNAADLTVVGTPATGVWTHTAARNGFIKYTYSVDDEAGNSNAISETTLANLFVDVTAPATPVIDLTTASDTGASNSDNITKDATPTFSITNDNQRVKSSGGVAIDNTAGKSAESIEWHLTAAGSNTFTKQTITTASFTPAANLTDGVYKIKAAFIDAAGNKTESTVITFTVDTAVPSAPTALDLATADDTGVSNTDNITNKTTGLTFSVTATGENGSTVQLYSGTTAVGDATTVSGGSVSIDIPLSQGTHTITAKTTDTAGNVSTASSPVTVTVDTTAPADPALPDLTTDTGVSQTDNITNDNTPTITTPTVANATYEWTVDGSVASAYTTASITTTTLSDGNHTFSVKLTDQAGNQSDASPVLTITVDTTIPDATVSATNFTGHLSSTDLYINKADADDTSGAILTAPTQSFTYGYKVVGSSTACDSNVSYTSTIPKTSDVTTDGTHKICIKAVDTAGNIQYLATPTFTRDVAVPATPALPDLATASDLGSSNSDNITSDNTPTITTPSITNATYEWTIDGTVSNTLTTASITTTALSDGNHTFSVKVTDQAGNQSTASPVLTITIDTDDPGISVIRINDTDTTIDADTRFIVVALDTTATISYAKEAKAACTSRTSPTNSVYTVGTVFDPDNNAASGYCFIAADLAGNLSKQHTDDAIEGIGSFAIQGGTTESSTTYTTSGTKTVTGITASNTKVLLKLASSTDDPTTYSATQRQTTSFATTALDVLQGGTAFTTTLPIASGDTGKQIIGWIWTDKDDATTATPAILLTTLVVDDTPPTITPGTITSSNSNPAFAKQGDTITATFTTNEVIAAHTVVINGLPATCIDSSNSFTCTATLTNAADEGAATLVASVTDRAGNTTKSTITNQSITIDATAPAVAVSGLRSKHFKATGTEDVTITITDSNEIQAGTYTITATGATLSTCTLAVPASTSTISETCTLTTASATDGTPVVLTIPTLLDASGNSKASHTITLGYVDTRAPQIGNAPSFDASKRRNLTFNLDITHNQHASNTNPETITPVFAGDCERFKADTDWSGTTHAVYTTTLSVPQGTYKTCAVAVEDEAGNVSSFVSFAEFRIKGSNGVARIGSFVSSAISSVADVFSGGTSPAQQVLTQQEVSQAPPTLFETTFAPEQTTPPSADTPDRDLTIGSVGEDVRDLQRLLNGLGFIISGSGSGSPGQESTYFGEKTRQALIRYQLANGISPASGYYGPLTRASLAGQRQQPVPQQQVQSQQQVVQSQQQDIQTPPAPVPTPSTRDLAIGSVGEDVRALQRLLNSLGFTISESGAGSPGQESAYFGEKTRQALIRYQIANGISPASGYYGPLTRSSIAGQSSPQNAGQRQEVGSFVEESAGEVRSFIESVEQTPPAPEPAPESSEPVPQQQQVEDTSDYEPITEILYRPSPRSFEPPRI